MPHKSSTALLFPYGNYCAHRISTRAKRIITSCHQRNKCTFRIFFSTVLFYLLPNRKQFFLYFLVHSFLHFVNKQHQHQSNYIQIDKYNYTFPEMGQLISPMLPTQTIGAFRHSFTVATGFCFSRAVNRYSIALWVLS